MTISFFPTQPDTAQSLAGVSVHAPIADDCQSSQQANVSIRPTGCNASTLTDAEREAEITAAGECIARFLKLGWTAEAHAQRKRMYALINGRSTEAVRRLEIRRGLI